MEEAAAPDSLIYTGTGSQEDPIDLTTPIRGRGTEEDPIDLTAIRNEVALRKAAGPARRSQSGQRLRRFVFTLNNWTQEEWTYLTEVFPKMTAWLIIGKETGANGTPHLQGACILGSQWSFSKIKTLIGFNRAHIERMNGKPEDSRAYCTKEDSNAFETGTLGSTSGTTQGKRNDLAIVVERIRGGESLKDLTQDDSGGMAVVKWHKGLTILRSLTRKARTNKPFVLWMFGQTGTGKTRCAFELGRALSRDGFDGDIWVSSGTLRWFDGYDGQSVVIFDDFRAKQVPSFAFFLRLLDRYPLEVEFKGGFVGWNPAVIICTCPYDVDECFRTRKEHVPEDIAQLNRRIDKVVELESLLTDDERGALIQEISTLVRGE